MSSKNHDPPPSSQPGDSLLRRLAGPSSTKAGLAKDQTEINRMIAEVSKGSKFYENEKRKDKDLTERIARILKLRDEVVKGVDLKKVEEGVDKLLVQLEAQRDLSQYIVHIDMDAFFANVELLDKPDLAGKPFGVGHGVLCTASYEARKFGVRSGMAGFVAKKLCPELILLPLQHARYSEMSARVMSVFRRYDPHMSVAGCDEGYLNITQYCEEHNMKPEECVAEMRRIVAEETKLTASAGIAPNKMLAKICSDRNKPNGQFKLDFEPAAIKAFTHDLSIRKVPGVGRVNERLLDSIGIKTCGDIFEQRAVLSLLDRQFGLTFLLQTYLGIASNVVAPWQREERKSIGAERTFHPISNTARIYAKLEEVAAELARDMSEDGWTGKTVTLKYKLDTYQVFTRAKSFTAWVSGRQEDLLAIGKELLKPELPLKLRLIGLRITKLKDLKAESESKARGIKRFFNSAGTASPSSRKKPRVAYGVEDMDEELPQLSQDGFATAMPGFHEDADLDADADEDAADKFEATADVGGPSTSMKPISARGADRAANSSGRPRSSSHTHSATAIKTEPEGKEEREIDSADAKAIPTLECPICGRHLETDNRGFNAHVDFCLSKEAIREAQTASLSSKPPSSGSGAGFCSSSSAAARRTGHKPMSKLGKKERGGSTGHGEGLLRFTKRA